jgi:hypothetical protein
VPFCSFAGKRKDSLIIHVKKSSACLIFYKLNGYFDAHDKLTYHGFHATLTGQNENRLGHFPAVGMFDNIRMGQNGITDYCQQVVNSEGGNAFQGDAVEEEPTNVDQAASDDCPNFSSLPASPEELLVGQPVQNQITIQPDGASTVGLSGVDEANFRDVDPEVCGYDSGGAKTIILPNAIGTVLVQFELSICHICQFRGVESDVREHMNLCHRPIKTISCGVCKFSSNNVSEVTDHIAVSKCGGWVVQ